MLSTDACMVAVGVLVCGNAEGIGKVLQGLEH